MTTLTWPLRLAPNGSLAAVEQDTDEDIDSCVTAILSYPERWRDDNPAFGCHGLLFRKEGIDVDAVTRAVSELEPRATPDIVAGVLAQGVQDVTVNVVTANG